MLRGNKDVYIWPKLTSVRTPEPDLLHLERCKLRAVPAGGAGLAPPPPAHPAQHAATLQVSTPLDGATFRTCVHIDLLSLPLLRSSVLFI